MSIAVLEPPVPPLPFDPDPTPTPEELLEMSDGVGFELVDGQLVERNLSMESSWVGGELFRLLGNHCREKQLGFVFPADAGYECFPDSPKKIRRPDVSFVAHSRFPNGTIPVRFMKLAPDLAVEVVSPHDLYENVLAKVGEYLSVGVRLVWIIDPKQRAAQIYRLDGTTTFLRSGGELSGEDVVPEFRCPLKLLAPPSIVETAL